MGVRAGQGFGRKKPKRLTCPDCKKQGVTQWKPTPVGLVRHCRYCQSSWGEAGWRLMSEGRQRQGRAVLPAKPYWLLSLDQRQAHEHYLSQFITARCPACGCLKVLVDGDEHTVNVNGEKQLLAAYYAVCDECSNVWCRAASPDLVVDQCLAQTAAMDLDVRVPTSRLDWAPDAVNERVDGKSFAEFCKKLDNLNMELDLQVSTARPKPHN